MDRPAGDHHGRIALWSKSDSEYVSGLRIGQSIEITYRGTLASAVIRNVRLMEDGRWGVGLEALI